MTKPSTLQEIARQAQGEDRVVSARICLLDYHVKRGLLFPGMDERNNELHELIDNLLAGMADAVAVAVEYEVLSEMTRLMQAQSNGSYLDAGTAWNRLLDFLRSEYAHDVRISTPQGSIHPFFTDIDVNDSAAITQKLKQFELKCFEAGFNRGLQEGQIKQW